jgi:predicted RNA binding protein YcfA (HicA-like mRNA interferase family)/predicted RNase H-like HicB family nuclease
MERHAVFM